MSQATNDPVEIDGKLQIAEKEFNMQYLIPCLLRLAPRPWVLDCPKKGKMFATSNHCKMWTDWHMTHTHCSCQPVCQTSYCQLVISYLGLRSRCAIGNIGVTRSLLCVAPVTVAVITFHIPGDNVLILHNTLTYTRPFPPVHSVCCWMKNDSDTTGPIRNSGVHIRCDSVLLYRTQDTSSQAGLQILEIGSRVFRIADTFTILCDSCQVFPGRSRTMSCCTIYHFLPRAARSQIALTNSWVGGNQLSIVILTTPIGNCYWSRDRPDLSLGRHWFCVRCQAAKPWLLVSNTMLLWRLVAKRRMSWSHKDKSILLRDQ